MKAWAKVAAIAAIWAGVSVACFTPNGEMAIIVGFLATMAVILKWSEK